MTDPLPNRFARKGLVTPTHPFGNSGMQLNLAGFSYRPVINLFELVLYSGGSSRGYTSSVRISHFNYCPFWNSPFFLGRFSAGALEEQVQRWD